MKIIAYKPTQKCAIGYSIEKLTVNVRSGSDALQRADACIALGLPERSRHIVFLRSVNRL
jgi:hypothetical protein